MGEFKKMDFGALGFVDQKTRTKFDWELLRALNDLYLNLEGILNHGIDFEKNADVKLVSFTSNGSADTEDTVAHGLGKTPTGYIVYYRDKAGVLYDSQAHDATNLYLKCNVATTAFKVMVF